MDSIPIATCSFTYDTPHSVGRNPNVEEWLGFLHIATTLFHFTQDFTVLPFYRNNRVYRALCTLSAETREQIIFRPAMDPMQTFFVPGLAYQTIKATVVRHHEEGVHIDSRVYFGIVDVFSRFAKVLQEVLDESIHNPDRPKFELPA